MKFRNCVSLFDIIIIGAGHAGCEAALSSSRLNKKVLLITNSIDKISKMSCNPAIGGVGKGHLVKEMDAIGGAMPKVADNTGINFQTLNISKGPAVRATRCQSDMSKYSELMKRKILSKKNIYIRQDNVKNFLIRKEKVYGINGEHGGEVFSKRVIITTGTFLNGVIHLGASRVKSGRLGEISSNVLSNDLKKNGFYLGRLKTGTCPRLNKNTINWKLLEKQSSDLNTSFFSFDTKSMFLKQIPCYITYTNKKTHMIIKEEINKGHSPIYNGRISSTGPRYCLSIEDKVVRFSDKKNHQIFLEPHGLNTCEIYPNGLSTSLSPNAQVEFLRTIKGLEMVEVTRWGYAIEYDYVFPTQLNLNLESKRIKGLYFAGQINGTTGYEEAASQGLIAGINASLSLNGEDSIILNRYESYIGILIDDLVTLGTKEPYRMFTSRAEYRLILRYDNAYKRLSEIGFKCGLLKKEKYEKIIAFESKVSEAIQCAKREKINPSLKNNKILLKLESSKIKNSISISDLLKRPEINCQNIKYFKSKFNYSNEIMNRSSIEVKYEGYIKRAKNEIMKIKELEKCRIPRSIFNKRLDGISLESFEKLKNIRPRTLGQASRISGVTNSAICIIAIEIKRFRYN
jgi:tRNA uridine 5-carboxymethylaminomethyl modification enzyme